MRRKLTALIAVAGVLCAGTPATAVGGPNIDWGECPAVSESANDRGLECGTIAVPVDYRKPDGRTLEVAVSRLRSGDPARRRGVLLVNPGGPGVAGLELPVKIADRGAPAELLASYDLIGFDPRGVGRSSPVSCGLSPRQLVTAFGTYAHTREDVVAQAGRAEEIAKQCVANGGENLPHLTTRNTARDLDRIREALGEPKISYFGTSYGTYLGAVYAEMFPARSDRFLLDSAASPKMVWREQFRNWGLGTELRFPDFGSWAAARHDTYGLGRTAAEVRATFLSLAGKLDASPVGGVGGVDGTTFRQLTRFKLYTDAEFPELAQLWQQLAQGGAVSAPSAPAAPAAPAAPTVPSAPEDNFVAAYLAVTCGDVSWPRSLEHYQHAVRVDRERYPLIGAMTANITPCARWPLAPLEPPAEITGRGTHLVLQHLRDPATVYPGGVQLRRELGEGARLVTVDGGEHGIYPARNACADALATRWLVDGVLPRGDRYCA